MHWKPLLLLAFSAFTLGGAWFFRARAKAFDNRTSTTIEAVKYMNYQEGVCNGLSIASAIAVLFLL